MKKNDPKDETQSFIVRVWNEAEESDDHPTGWRGSIVNVGNGKRVYFKDLERVKGFIQEQTGMKTRSLLSFIKTKFKSMLYHG